MIFGGMVDKKAPAASGMHGAESGYSKKENSGKKIAEVKIGLLLPDSPDLDPLALAALQGAELAVSLANQSGGYQGTFFKLITRTADGLWGAGSKESVKFVYEDEVVAIMTALDGRNAHLAEQVATKSHVVQLATRATDETLSQAFVPWFFRIVPNDKQQAQALIDEIYREQDLHHVILVYEDIYDHRMAAETFKRMTEKNGFELNDMKAYSLSGSEAILSNLNADVEALIIAGSFDLARSLLDDIKKSFPEIQVFGMLSMTVDGRIGAGFSSGSEGGIFIGSRFCYTTRGQDFKNKFIEKYDHMPNPAASYAFDGTNLILEAIRMVGVDREKIRDALKEMKYQDGVTGPIEFDEYGNRISPVFMVRMIKGHPVILHP
jgi:branched-chain amino acid transport system substrate-binding protein